MKFYFSGITSQSELKLHEEAGATHLLIDQFHLGVIPATRQNVCVDSGAYYAWRNGINLDWAAYLRTLQSAPPRDFYFNLDVIGDAEATYTNWLHLKNSWVTPHSPLIPVWTWSYDHQYLQKYLDESHLVAIGGMVDIFRAKPEDPKDKETKKQLEKKRNQEFTKLLKLCHAYPQRFHILGLNWLAGLSELKKHNLIYSADTAKAYSAAKKTAYFQVNANGTLICTPLTYLQKYLPPNEYQTLLTSRSARLHQAISTIERFFH